MAANLDEMVDLLKALGEPTRLRLVRLLWQSDLTVSDLVSILGQSQPRVSRHLKLLVETGALLRYQEGAWAYFRLSADGSIRTVTDAVLRALSADDPVLARDGERLDAVRRQRADRAARYFAENAARWDEIRSLHVPDTEVEEALVRALGQERIGSLLDVGTGTGRMLQLLAPRSERALGIDASREMLAFARAKLDAAETAHVSVRQGDAYHLPGGLGGFDLVTLHQVLHYLDDPAAAVREAASVLAPGGRLAIIDFAPHHHEFLREGHAHLRLGFSRETLGDFLDAAGLVREAELALDGSREEGSSANDTLTVTITIGRDRRAEPTSLARSA